MNAQAPIPTLDDIQQAVKQLEGRIVATPSIHLTSQRITHALPQGAAVYMKMELFQQAGSFKARGVLLAIDALTDAQKQAGVTTVSAGNHALAVAWGAHQADISATVVMPESADKIRIEGCKQLGANVILCRTIGDAFKEADRLVKEEGRSIIHPFESPFMVLGAASCGYEIAQATPHLEAMVIPIGGGGLIAGIASSFHHLMPQCQIIGVEPYGADAMYQSLQAAQPVELEKIDTIADSLGAPMSLPRTFSITRACIDEIIRLDDAAFIKAMQHLYHAMKIVAEPACSASLAAIIGPLHKKLAHKAIGIIACGSNISINKYSRIIGA